MKLIVLAGGFGTRLRSAVPSLPKALAPVLGRPFLHYQMDNWTRQGVTSFVFLLHHRAELIVDFLKHQRDASWCHADIHWVIESTPLGTGGSIVNAVRQFSLQGEFAVANADTWLGAGIADVLKVGAPSIGVVRVENAGRYGGVALSPDGGVARFVEKDVSAKGGWINAGISHLYAEMFVDSEIKPISLESDFYPEWAKNGLLRAAQLDCNFIDIGIPDEYYRFCRWIESGKMNAL
jgi:D-glycero-alpha-D-manno-heptose 1-phosphate guanylyltransferase